MYHVHVTYHHHRSLECLMQIVGLRMFSQDETLEFCCECYIPFKHKHIHRVSRGAATLYRLLRYIYTHIDAHMLCSVQSMCVICALTDVLGAHSPLNPSH